MTMALFERFTQEDPDDKRWTAKHEAAAALGVVALGYFTLNQLKAFWNTSAADNTDLNAIVGLVGPLSQADRLDWLKGLEWLLVLNESGAAAVDTAAKIRAKLGLA